MDANDRDSGAPREPTPSLTPPPTAAPMLAPKAAPDALLRQIGERVRATRRQRGESRAALALRSGVSARFLAQLEAGAANISLLRLCDIAEALGVGLETLLGFEPAATSASDTARQIQQLLEGRTAAESAEVRDWLAARFASARGPRVALLGLRGAGKSSVGARLAKLLGVPFYELDAMIEAAAGLPLEQIFELQGEPSYRRLERTALAGFLASTPAGVLATGGGLVTEPETYDLLRRRCCTIWLRAEPQLHWSRVVHQGDRRPMRDNPGAMIELRALLAAREPLYAQAQATVDTTGRSVVAVAADVAALVHRLAGGPAGAPAA